MACQRVGTHDPTHRVAAARRLNLKATAQTKAAAQTIERFYKRADAKCVPHGELLERALDALEKALD